MRTPPRIEVWLQAACSALRGGIQPAQAVNAAGVVLKAYETQFAKEIAADDAERAAYEATRPKP